MRTVIVTIRGRVQGVGFRAFVRSQAIASGVSGEVWNATDGSVRAILQSNHPQLVEALVDSLRQGPGRVDSVVVQERSEAQEHVGFSIGPTRST